MSSFGEHSGTLERTKLRVGRYENYTKSQGRLTETKNWLFGKELSIKDINTCPVHTKEKPDIEPNTSSIEPFEDE